MLQRVFFASAALLFFALFFHTSFEFDQDLGRHLLLGEIISKTGQVPNTNLFSYTHPDFPFFNMHWLWEVFVYQFSLHFGVSPLIPVHAILMTLALSLILYTALRVSKSVWATAISLVVLAPILLERTNLRPEIFSYVFTAIFVYAIFTRSRFLYLLPLIELIWVNSHIYFFLGPALLIILSLVTRDKKIIVVTVLTGLATLFNPHGFFGATYPLRVFENYGYTIVENQPPFFLETLISNPNIFYFKVALTALLISYIVAPLRLLNLVLIIFLILPLSAVRSFPFVFLIFLPVLADNLRNNRLIKNFSEKKTLAVAIVVTLWRTWSLISGDYYLRIGSEKSFGMEVVESGKRAVDYIKANNLRGPMFNNFDIGGYLDYRLYPDERVFVDNRPGEYPVDFFQKEYIPAQESAEKFAELDKKYGFNLIVFSHTDATPWAEKFLTEIVKNPKFNLVYIDDYAIVFATQKLALEIKLGKPLALARVYQLLGRQKESQMFLLQAIAKNPNINKKPSLILF